MDFFLIIDKYLVADQPSELFAFLPKHSEIKSELESHHMKSKQCENFYNSVSVERRPSFLYSNHATNS